MVLSYGAVPIEWKTSLVRYCVIGVQTQKISNFKLHAIDFGEEARYGRTVIDRIRFRLPQIGGLFLEMSNSL